MSNKLVKSEVALERGKRLRFVRNITGMVTHTFGRLCGIGRTTVSSWEQGINPLTERGAEKVVHAVRKEGIRCTTLWLLHGIGEAPKIVEQDKLSKLNYQTLTPVETPSLEEIQTSYKGSDLEKEIELFKATYPEHLIYRIQDDSMQPIYREGEWVGGVRLSQEALDLAHGMDCIVQLKNGLLIVRRAKIESLGALKLSLYGINAEVSVEHPPMRHMIASQIVALAPIIRIWRDSLIEEKAK
jgi:DNA-binding transcriptional regulator YiaG